MKKTGKNLEYLVQLLEKSISPDSTVKQNVHLPILNSATGATTQCDVVIYSGQKPRQTLTIVEVQDRTSQVKPNDFRGWQQKLLDVGAQHLICVSRKEFPKSIKEKATSSGNTVHLITLKELTAESIPLDMFKIDVQHGRFKLTSLNKVIFGIKQADEPLFQNLKGKTVKEADNKFSLNKENLISFYSLCLSLLKRNEEERKGSYIIKHEPDTDPPLYYKINDLFIRIGIEVEFEWEMEIIQIPVSILSYEQHQHGALAWVIDAQYQSPDGPVGWKIPLIKTGNFYSFSTMILHMPYKEFNVEIKIPERLKFTT